MRRRTFLRAALAGTVGAFLGGLPKAVAGPVREGFSITLTDAAGKSATFCGGVSVWYRRIRGNGDGSEPVRMVFEPGSDTWKPDPRF